MTRTWWDAKSHPTPDDDALRTGAMDAVAKFMGFETWRDYATHDLENPHPLHDNSRITWDYVMIILGGVHPYVEALRERVAELEAEVLRERVPEMAEGAEVSFDSDDRGGD